MKYATAKSKTWFGDAPYRLLMWLDSRTLPGASYDRKRTGSNMSQPHHSQTITKRGGLANHASRPQNTTAPSHWWLRLIKKNPNYMSQISLHLFSRLISPTRRQSRVICRLAKSDGSCPSTVTDKVDGLPEAPAALRAATKAMTSAWWVSNQSTKNILCTYGCFQKYGWWE